MTTLTDRPLSLSEAGAKLAEELAVLHINRRIFNSEAPPYRVEIEINPVDFLLWLNAQENAVKIFWEDRAKSFMIAGIGSADIISAKKGEEEYKIASRIEKCLSPNFPNLQYYGGFSFNPKYPQKGEWKNWGLGRFVLPLIEIRQTGNVTTLACNIVFNKEFEKTRKSVVQQLLNLRDPEGGYASNLTPPWRRLNIPDLHIWKASAAYIINAISQNKFQKVVLARCVRLDFKDAVNPFLLMSRLRETASNCFCFVFQFQNGESFVGATPERLYKRTGEHIETEALAGTRPRSDQATKDSILQNDLLSSDKDKKEQNFVVEMIKNSLKSLCTTINVDENPSLLNWSAGHHLITRFTGQLKKDISDKTLIKNLHPTPAVAGTPTITALKEIIQIEIFDRGWYCGPVGYIGLNQSEFAVAIRSSLLRDKSAHLYAGAGIIKESSPETEWEETENKLINFLKIFDVSQK